MNDATARYRETFGEVAPSLPGAGIDWLAAARRGALARFEQLGFPTPRDEDWKYTRVAAIERRAFAPAPRADAMPDLGALLLPEDAIQLVFVDGHFRADLSPGSAAAPAGVRLRSLADALREEPETLERHLGRAAQDHAHAFTALNTAFAGDGVLVALEAGVTLDAPVHLLFVTTGRDETMTHPRIVVECAEDSRATLVETYAALGDSAYLNNVVTEATLADGATLEHYKQQRESTSAFHVSTLRVHQRARSRFVSHSASLGAAIARHDIDVLLDAPGASCELNGLYVARARQHVDYHTRIDHARPECTSTETYKGILAGRARGVFNGRVYVHPGAQKTDASQSNHNLLLSRDAEVDTKPQLEIYADDVKCAHGATVGQLDERMIFYLRSRGITEDAARALLTYGFARDVVDRMRIPALRESVAEALLERMPNADDLRSMLA